MEEFLKRNGICHLRKDGSLLCYDKIRKKIRVVPPAHDVMPSDIEEEDMIALMDKLLEAKEN